MRNKAKQKFLQVGVKSYLAVRKVKDHLKREDGNQTIEMVVFAFIIGIMVIFAATSLNTSLRSKFSGILQNINGANSQTNL
jgi:Flp pilus assembly pilin Flp